MKNSLCLAGTVRIGIAIGVSLQLLLFGGSEAVAQRKGTVHPHRITSSSNSLERVDPAKTAKPDRSFGNNKKFDPEDNGNPDGTRGSGTRCVR